VIEPEGSGISATEHNDKISALIFPATLQTILLTVSAGYCGCVSDIHAHEYLMTCSHRRGSTFPLQLYVYHHNFT
jgi:hypothetical protein